MMPPPATRRSDPYLLSALAGGCLELKFDIQDCEG